MILGPYFFIYKDLSVLYFAALKEDKWILMKKYCSNNSLEIFQWWRIENYTLKKHSKTLLTS